MSPSTIGERRGLIILLALILVTALVSTVISSGTSQPDPTFPVDSATMTPATPTDTAVHVHPLKHRQRKEAKPKRKKLPRYRSPLDEPV